MLTDSASWDSIEGGTLISELIFAFHLRVPCQSRVGVAEGTSY